MRAVIYARVSSQQQRDAHTIESQLRTLPEFVTRRGWDLVRPSGHYVDDGRSAKAGKLEKRGAFRRLAKDAAAHLFDVLVIVDFDRLTRSEDLIERAEVLGAFQRTGILVAIASTGQVLDLNSADGDLMATLGGYLAAQENRVKRERTLRGHEQSALRGHKAHGKTPYGLFWSLDSRTWSEHPVEAPIVREIFARVAAGESAMSVGRDLEARGAPRPRSGHWQHAVWRIIAKPTYRGRWVADQKRGLFVDVPAIVDDATWFAAQDAMKRGSLRGLRRTRHTYLCEGLVVCGDCGSRMYIHRESAARANGREGYYQCSRRRLPKSGRCTMPMRRIGDVDGRVWAAIAELLGQPRHRLLGRIAEKRGEVGRDAELWSRDIDSYRAQLERLGDAESAILDRFVKGLITESAMDGHVKAVAARRAFLSKQLAAAEATVQQADIETADMSHLGGILDELREMLPTATAEEQQAIIRAVVKPAGVHIASDGGITVDVGLGQKDDGGGAIPEPCEGAAPGPCRRTRCPPSRPGHSARRGR